MLSILENYSTLIIIASAFVLAFAIFELKGFMQFILKLIIFSTTISFMFNSKIALAKNFRQNYTIDKNRNLKAVNNDDPWNNSASENEAIVNPLDSDTYIVKAGDNLYSIAKQFTKNENSINELWIKIVNGNINSLISGDPNLIYPNEVIQIPR